MARRPLALLLLAPVAALALTACGEAEQAANDAASGVASRAAGAAVDQVRGQVCDRVADGQVSVQDKQVLAGLVDAARSAGLPEEVAGPLDQIASSGDQVPADAVGKLTEACRP